VIDDGAEDDVDRLVETLAAELEHTWSATPATAILTNEAPAFAG
jgi:hypothetical protein